MSVLAQDIGLPVPDVHLEMVDGHQGLVSILVPPGGRAWELVSDDTLRALAWDDRDLWTTYVAFDVFAGNIDRHSENIYVHSAALLGAGGAEEEHGSLSLIDFGWSGLWPVYKFGNGLGPADLQRVAHDADIRDEWKFKIRNNMPVLLRNGIAYRGTPEREQAVANVRRITDVDIGDAADAVLDPYMSDTARGLTKEFLSHRLARLDTLLDTVFPQ